MKQLLIIKLVVWFGWLSYIALAQLDLSDALTGSVSFPEAGITCLGNLAAFITSFLRRRLDLENWARDIMATRTGKELERLKDQEGLGTDNWKNASVLMLSEDVSDRSIRQFMKYIQNAHFVASILLPINTPGQECNCIVFSATQDIKDKLFNMLPEEVLISLNNSRLLLRSIECLKKCWHCQEKCCYCQEKCCDCQHKGCHCPKKCCHYQEEGCHCPKKCCHRQEEGCHCPEMCCHEKGCHCRKKCCHCEEEGCHCAGKYCHCQEKSCHCYRSVVDFPAVCYALQSTKLIRKKPMCICIPLNPASQDDWTKVLIRIFKSKDQEDRGATVNASEALQKYLDEKVKEGTSKEVLFRTALTIVPRLAEILINVVLTLWFKIDGFSSSLVARRAIRNHVVDSKGVGFPASAFLTRAEIQVNSDGASVCQVLSFRCAFSSIGTLSLIVGLFNLSCSSYWAVYIALHRSAGKWYEIHAPLPSKPRIVVIMSAICFGLLLDSWDLKKAICTKKTRWSTMLKVFVMMMIEVAFLIVVGLFLNKGIGRWVYSALQAIVWFKWGVGSWLLGVYSPDYHSEYPGEQPKWVDDGSLVYSSAFLLNAVLAGVRGNWAGVRPAN